jgi:hypothetical protein
MYNDDCTSILTEAYNFYNARREDQQSDRYKEEKSHHCNTGKSIGIIIRSQR